MSIPKYIQYARELRKNQTEEEDILWDLIRNRRLNGFKFLRQHPIVLKESNGIKKFYITDFYCAEKKLIIEIDGETHLLQKEYDIGRDNILQEMGYTTLRITNNEIKNNVKTIIIKIEQFLK